MSAICRICLDGNTTVYSLKDNRLINVFEKLSNTQFNYDDARPRALCCYCYRKLQRCHNFSEMAKKSEKIFTYVYEQGLEATYEFISEINTGMKQQLSVANMQYITIEDSYGNTNKGSQVTIKDEPISIANMNEELTTEQDKLVEVGYIAENCTRNQSTFQEYCSDLGNDLDEHPNTNFEQTERNTEVNEISIDNQKEMALMPSACEQLSKNPRIHKHVVNHPGKAQWACILCNKQFAGKRLMVEHNRNTHKRGNKFFCDVCDKQYMKKNQLIEHIKTHTREKLECNVCDKQFRKKSTLVTHLKAHTGELFDCNLCDKKLSTKKTLVDHIAIHTGEKRFACNVCDKYFILKSTLVTHLKTHPQMFDHMAIREKLFTCNVCNKQLAAKKKLIDHMSMHTGEKSFACNICDKHFNLTSQLVRHQKTHTREKFACNICDKQLSTKVTLDNHMTIHTGEKPLACNECGKTYIHKYDLVKHLKTHRETFACNLCGKQSSTKNSLVPHMAIHTREKSFV